jgi:hypothetical protein
MRNMILCLCIPPDVLVGHAQFRQDAASRAQARRCLAPHLCTRYEALCVNTGNCAGNLAKRWLRPTALFLGTLTAAVLVASLSGTSVRVFTILSLAKIVFQVPSSIWPFLSVNFPHPGIFVVLTHFLEDLRTLIAPSFSVRSPV